MRHGHRSVVAGSAGVPPACPTTEQSIPKRTPCSVVGHAGGTPALPATTGLALCAFWLLCSFLVGFAPRVPGSPKLVRIAVEPASVELVGEQARARLVVTGRYSDGSVR